MANVTVETDTLKNGGTNTQTIYDNNEVIYNKIMNLDCGSLSSFDLFKTALATKNDVFKEHTNILNNKINECANELEEIDNLIANNVITPLASADSIEFTDDGLEVTQLANYELSNDIDYTFDPSNVGISAQELYAKAEVIKNSNLPMNIKIVKVAKLLHEYTLGWKWDREKLEYGSFEDTLEITTKTIVCATGVSDALYLAGAVDTIVNQVGIFNPNYQENVLVTAQKNGWQKVDLNELQPGDIIFTGYDGSGYGHVEIYAGNGYAYTWGGDQDMAREGPKEVSSAGYQNAGACAYRVTTTRNA